MVFLIHEKNLVRMRVWSGLVPHMSTLRPACVWVDLRVSAASTKKNVLHFTCDEAAEDE
jgi:hypothetical protein